MKLSTNLGQIVGVVLLIGACGSPEEDATDDPLAPPAWGGAVPHLTAQGNINGEAIDIRLEGDAAREATRLFCVREYEPGADKKPALVEVKIKARVAAGGKERLLETELKRHNFQADKAGTSLRVIPRADGVEPPPDAIWYEWEWHDVATDETQYESAAQTGAFVLHHISGTPGADNVVPENDGFVGGTLAARWSEKESLKLSFYAPCTANKIAQ